ncbi:MAG TPA: 16S rRNA (cytidine(1402)-2'-O)-methyltransferase [Clostridiales bacterium]|nr:16S rRNA (cytidine(1402)-2'-O)-methyltransferase [Clostridiales bacterium]
MAGILYLVATPIGNLGDISHRALEVLSGVDFIAAEDTRVSLKLLNHFGIKKPLVSYYEHNRAASGERILERLLKGESCALVTDAGMPAISDPGEDLVRLCVENGVRVVGIPGPCAAISALAVSGLPTQRFCFEGFLSTSKKNRFAHLEAIKDEQRTMIFYEAPHKLLNTLRDFLEILGDREVVLCRELTKLHEEILRTTLSGAIAHYEETPPKGEFVIVLRGAPEERQKEMPPEEAVKVVDGYRNKGHSLKESAKLASEETGYSKNELYNMYVNRPVNPPV